MKEINVDANNSFYSSDNGMLYDKNRESLLLVPYAVTEVTIPEGVIGIGENAAYSCTNLTSVSIPASVTSMGEGIFDCIRIFIGK